MDCIKCKKPLQDDFLWCPYCGKKQVVEKKHRKRANNTGTIYKREGNLERPWIAKKNNMYIGSYKTRTEAQKALERITDVDVTEKYNMTFAQVYERWKAEHSREISDKLMKNYQLAYSQCPQLHDMMMRKILRSDYQAAIILLEAKGMSKSTCQKLRVLLGQLSRWAMDEGITLTNPAQELTTVAKQKSERDVFTDKEIEAIKKAKSPAADIALILISCGCRPGELFTVPLANCWEDHFIGGSKTEAGKNRVIPIGPDGIAAYRKIRAKAIEEGERLLIGGYSGANKTAPNFTKRDWRELMEEVKIDGMTPYNCRHTFITRAIVSGMDLPKLEAIVGHVDRETTKIYTHLHAHDLVEAVQNIKSTPLAVVNKLSTRSEPEEKNIQKSS
jgi:integrase